MLKSYLCLHFFNFWLQEFYIIMEHQSWVQVHAYGKVPSHFFITDGYDCQWPQVSGQRPSNFGGSSLVLCNFRGPTIKQKLWHFLCFHHVVYLFSVWNVTCPIIPSVRTHLIIGEGVSVINTRVLQLLAVYFYFSITMAKIA